MDPQIDIHVEISIAAPRERVWTSLIEGFGEWFSRPDVDMGLRLEPKPGGRMYRDLGDDTGHLWGHVQVIKPPGLLEIVGPLAISDASISHVTFRLEESDAGTVVKLTHRGVGLIPEGTAEGMAKGWPGMLEELKNHAERS